MDIVEQLRESISDEYVPPLYMEAADEIERLNRLVDSLRAEVAVAKRDALEAKQDVRDLLGLKDDNKRLRELLREANVYLKNTGWGKPGVDLPDRIDAALSSTEKT